MFGTGKGSEVRFCAREEGERYKANIVSCHAKARSRLRLLRCTPARSLDFFSAELNPCQRLQPPSSTSRLLILRSAIPCQILHRSHLSSRHSPRISHAQKPITLDVRATRKRRLRCRLVRKQDLRPVLLLSRRLTLACRHFPHDTSTAYPASASGSHSTSTPPIERNRFPHAPSALRFAQIHQPQLERIRNPILPPPGKPILPVPSKAICPNLASRCCQNSRQRAVRATWESR